MEAVREWVTDFVYPKRCASCGERGRWVCDHCRRQLRLFDDAICDRCGFPNLIDPCRCGEMPAAVDRIRSVGPFAGWLRDSVLAFKYEDEWARISDLAPYLVGIVGCLSAVDLVVPVPLHQSRLRERGYNQSALLAKTVAGTLNLRYADVLVRTRATAPQARLGAAARLTNVESAFAPASGFDAAGLRTVLVDDVLTTGATLGAAARALRDAGAATVIAVTLARQV